MHCAALKKLRDRERCTKMAAFSMGTAAGTDIPIEHLDYGYISGCSSASELEKIVKVLR